MYFWALAPELFAYWQLPACTFLLAPARMYFVGLAKRYPRLNAKGGQAKKAPETYDS
jgi:hypothetical protein